MTNYIKLLQQLISTPSFSREEKHTADILAAFLSNEGIQKVQREHNNVWVYNLNFDPVKPTILLNSHHDTVSPNGAWSRDPFIADITDGKLYGLGSNDAGGSVVSLIAAFLHFYKSSNLKYNLCLAITGEEEISGNAGIESILPQLGELSFAIVGEPTQMHLAIAERGLMVLDCVAHGTSGHAARNEGVNAIYEAIKDIEWFRNYRFSKESELFGGVTMNVTIISAGTQHNVIPAECRFTVDVRVTDCYTNEEVLEEIRRNVSSEVFPRSTRLKSSHIDPSHPIVAAGIALGRNTYGSPTTSDQTLLSIPSLKMGPGDSSRSHSADEFIYVEEIEDGIKQYITMLENICQ